MSSSYSEQAPNLPPPAPRLDWLPRPETLNARLRALAIASAPSLDNTVALARCDLDFLQTGALERVCLSAMRGGLMEAPGPDVRLAVLGSATTAHLEAGIRIAGLRRRLMVEVRHGGPGRYWQDIFGEAVAVDDLRPTAVLLSLDPWHLTAGLPQKATEQQRRVVLSETMDRIRRCWDGFRARFGCQILHQMPLPVLESDLGGNDHRLPGSRAELLRRLASELRDRADEHGVDLLSLDLRAAQDGCDRWHDRVLWLRARQEISPRAAPIYGDLVMRLIAARMGRSAKCLVLDLDNTLWGGEVGECGVEGIALGQGSAQGEAFVAMQRYALALNARGVVLAVCSKNAPAAARGPFQSHPEMLLRLDHIAVFKAGWGPKPEAIQTIADELGLGTDALVFVDDSAFERGLVRAALPEVAVPELPDEPAHVPRRLADAGYFEALSITPEDRSRADDYLANRDRGALKRSLPDLDSYLRELGMKLEWSPFNAADIPRLAQLSGRTNQFNLTGRRYDIDRLRLLADDPCIETFQFRLRDRFGDNGLIALAVVRREARRRLVIDNLQMSCRVLGRRVEEAILSVLAERAHRLSQEAIIGDCVPGARNGLVQDLYPRLGFTETGNSREDARRYILMLERYEAPKLPIESRRAAT